MTSNPADVQVTHKDKSLAWAIMIEFNGDREKLPLLQEWIAKERTEAVAALQQSRSAVTEAAWEYMSQFGQALEAHGISCSPAQVAADEKLRAALSQESAG